MNIRVPQQPRATRAAEGLPRRAFSVAEVERMVELGLIGDDERVELIGGELVPMAAKGIRHQHLWTGLLRHWFARLPNELWLSPEETLKLSDDTFLEPDIAVLSRHHAQGVVTGNLPLLVVEVADTSLGFDLGPKALLYAKYGVRELWVIDAVRMVTHVHRGPGQGGYAEVSAVPSAVQIVPLYAADLALSLDDVEMP